MDHFTPRPRPPGQRDRDLLVRGSLWLGVVLLAVLTLATGCLASLGSPGGQHHTMVDTGNAAPAPPFAYPDWERSRQVWEPAARRP